MPLEDKKYVNRSEEYEVNYILSVYGKGETEENRKTFLDEADKVLEPNEKLLRTKAEEIIENLGEELLNKEVD